MRQALEMIQEAEKPFIFVGGGAVTLRRIRGTERVCYIRVRRTGVPIP